MSWLGELAPSARQMDALERLPEAVVVDDGDAREIVALWHHLEAYCAERKRVTAAALARRGSMATGLFRVPGGPDLTVTDPDVAPDELGLRLGSSKRAAR